MIALLTAVAQLVFLILQTKFEQDKQEKARRDALLTGWTQAIKSGDKSKITAMLDTINAK